MKIASGVAQGLEYLHEKANPPIIYRDLKSSTILLDQDFNPKLSDYGLAKLEGRGSNTLLTPGVMGTGYCAPEYERTGELTLKSDVYSFGVVLVELISGRRAVDPARPLDQQNLVEWARPIFRDPKRFPEMADPLLKKAFPMTSLNQAVGVAAMCLQEEASVRPLFGDVVAALSFLGVASTDEPPVPTAQLKDTVGPPPDDPERDASDSDSDNQSSDSSSSSSSDHSDNEDEGEDTELQRAKSPRITNTRSSSIRSNTSSSSSDDDDNDKNDYFISRRTSNSEKSSHETDSIDFRNDRISYTDEAGGDLSSNEDLSSRLMVDFDKAPQESDSINLRTDRISDPDEDGGDLSFCYSVSASENLRSNSSIRESADEEDPMKESIMKPENRSFGSYSMSSDEGSDEEERSRR
ncbi:unnamed protein product [Cuscuta campestris]|uniref:Protein kinase domain-containing protein n=1 Tax=Cuscuta campestris TaxID=132261 RepID=A0A484LQX7_9ASTE|nr:unnamed protein product [Cuscuta campestris]